MTEDFQKLIENPQANGIQLFFAEQAQGRGNQMLAVKLQKLFGYKWSRHPLTPLAGVRVLNLSRSLPGPYATLVLADLGAQVDKIEDTAGGDYLRIMPPTVKGGGGMASPPTRRRASSWR